MDRFDRRLIFDGDGWPDIKKKIEEVIQRPDNFKFEPEICRKFVKDNFLWERVAGTFEKEVIGLI